MRILIISAFYPPHVVGGWEQLVQDVNARLRARGHETHVLTSMHQVGGAVEEPGVSRVLALESDLYHYRPLDFLGYRRRLRQNLARTAAVVRRFNPDVIFVNVMFNLSRAVPWQAEQLRPGRVVYYVADGWPHDVDPHTAYWTDGAHNPLLALAKKLLAPLPLALVAQDQARYRLRFARVLCVSEMIRQRLARQAGIAPAALHVVYNGVETERFVPAARPADRAGLALLYAGSLVAHKGVHTAVSALALLRQQGRLDGITLDVVGSGHPEYEARLRALVDDGGLAAAVRFRGRVPREAMPALLQAFDALLLPSIWEEPLSRMMQEAMAAGLVVVGTLTGGSGELLVEGDTGLTFPPDDAAALAAQIAALAADRNLRARLRENGRAAVLERFDLERMIDGIETHLLAASTRQHKTAA